MILAFSSLFTFVFAVSRPNFLVKYISEGNITINKNKILEFCRFLMQRFGIGHKKSFLNY